jgi:hypothetical protein
MTEDPHISTCSRCGCQVEVPLFVELLLGDDMEEIEFVCRLCVFSKEDGVNWNEAPRA